MNDNFTTCFNEVILGEKAEIVYLDLGLSSWKMLMKLKLRFLTPSTSTGIAKSRMGEYTK